jgi:heat shock protein HslJ
MPQPSRTHRALGALAVVLLLAGCTGHPGDGTVAGRWGSTAAGRPNLDIREDGAFTGSDGCNHLSGTARIDGDRVSFGAIASTLMACEGVDEWLARASAATVSGDTMTVKDEAGATIGTLRRSHG